MNETVKTISFVGAAALLVVPVALLVAYGLLRLSSTLFAELRDLVFAKATEEGVDLSSRWKKVGIVAMGGAVFGFGLALLGIYVCLGAVGKL